VNDLPIPDNLGFFALVNDTFRDTAAGDSFSPSTREFYIEDLKDRCFARYPFLILGREQVRDALSNVLYNLINDLRRKYGDAVHASGHGGAARDRNRESDDHA